MMAAAYVLHGNREGKRGVGGGGGGDGGGGGGDGGGGGGDRLFL